MSLSIRLICDNLRSASFNMAADLFLMERCATDQTVNLRLYSWERPSITIGLFQKADQILKLESLRQDGVDWIRRPTGGRAVYHFEDLTYSCIFPAMLASMGSSIKETYALIARCLRSGLEHAHIICETHDSDSELKELKRETKLPCFLAPNRDELMVDGKKLVGSAQRRTVSGVLQHGSIPITDAYLKLPEYLTISEQQCDIQKQLLMQKTTFVKSISSNYDFDILQKHIVNGFEMVLNCPVIDKPWSPDELSQIAALQNSDSFQNEYCKRNLQSELGLEVRQ